MLDKFCSSMVLGLIGLYSTLSLLYALDGNKNKAIYWLGAALINYAIYRMR